jgi:hypothetical protein
VQAARAEKGRRGGEEQVRPPLAAARAVAVSKLTRCVAGMAQLPSNTPSTATGATLWRICAASGRRSDAAARAAHHAHPIANLISLLLTLLNAIFVLCLPVARRCDNRTPQQNRPSMIHITRQKLVMFTFHCSHMAFASHVTRVVLFTQHTPLSQLMSQFFFASHFHVRFLKRHPP